MGGDKRAAAQIRGGRIAGVEPGSLADEAGLKVGDILLEINGRSLHDVLDYQFYAAEDELRLLVARDGHDETREFILELAGGGHLGIEFAESTFDGIRRCTNRCAFCFVRRLPKGMRRSLYVKDDDYRYSVSYGSFVTLTNLSEDDWSRLVEQRLSPLRVSVHATELDLRRGLLGNPNAPDILGQLRRAGELGLQAHTQLVLCPGVNDGAHLARSVADLSALYPVVQSIAAVPVGLGHAEGAGGLRLYTADEANAIVMQVTDWQREFRKRLGTGLIYLADEFYFLAGRPFPSGRKYDDYPQFENGIGLVRSLLDEWAALKRRGLAKLNRRASLTVVCGKRIAPLLLEIASGINSMSSLQLEVVPVENRFFGPSITVSGLLTGQDVADALYGRDVGDMVVLPRTMLDVAGARFLDDITPRHIEARVHRPVRFAGTLRGLIACALELETLAKPQTSH